MSRTNMKACSLRHIYLFSGLHSIYLPARTSTWLALNSVPSLHCRDSVSPPWSHPTLAPNGLKVFLAVNDHNHASGPTCVVPSSHRCPENPSSLAYFAGKGNSDGVSQTVMPNAIPFTAKAGDAMLMDLRTYHTAFANTSGHERRTLILMYQLRQDKQFDCRFHY